MIYLSEFNLPTAGQEENSMPELMKLTYYSGCYPFGIMRYRLSRIIFSDITVFYGGNGMGKSTVLNVIADRLGATNFSLKNRNDWFDHYVGLTEPEFAWGYRRGNFLCKHIASDDVFDCTLARRDEHDAADAARAKLVEHYRYWKRQPIPRWGPDTTNLKEYEDQLDIHRLTQSEYIKRRMGRDKPQMSNGEAAMDYFANQFEREGLILLDEPENSLSAEWQLELRKLMLYAARRGGMQLIVATHSPFLVSLPGAVVYDFDAGDKEPIIARPWYELKNMRLYYELFRENAEFFEK